MGTSISTGIIVIANALIVGLAIFYAVRYLFSCYSNTNVEKPYQFIFKLLIISISVNCSYFICEQIININWLISGSIRAIGEELLNTNISFEALIIKMNNVMGANNSLNVFSFDGIVKSFTSFGLFNLLFSYSLRYIMLKVFILISPLATVTLLNSSTSWIFKSWMKSVLSLLILQSIVAVVLLIIFATNFIENNILSKLLYIGSIYALMKANTYTSQIFGGISASVNSNISGLKNFIKS